MVEDRMYCKVGRFHWSQGIDGQCPNHPPGTKRTLPDGKVEGIHNCSEPDPNWEPPNKLPGYADLMTAFLNLS